MIPLILELGLNLGSNRGDFGYLLDQLILELREVHRIYATRHGKGFGEPPCIEMEMQSRSKVKSKKHRAATNCLWPRRGLGLPVLVQLVQSWPSPSPFPEYFVLSANCLI